MLNVTDVQNKDLFTGTFSYMIRFVQLLHVIFTSSTKLSTDFAHMINVHFIKFFNFIHRYVKKL